MDGLVRVNGEVTDAPASTPAPAAAPSSGHTTREIRDLSSVQQEDSPSEVTRAGQQAEKMEKEKEKEEEEAETVKTEEQRPSSGAEEQPVPPQRDQGADALQGKEQAEEQKAPTQPEEQTPVNAAPPLPPPPSRKEEQTPPKPPRHPESVPTFSGSAISSLIGGRNCVITTTIVTELTQTRVEPLQPDCRTNGQVTCSAADEQQTDQPISFSCGKLACYGKQVIKIQCLVFKQYTVLLILLGGGATYRFFFC